VESGRQGTLLDYLDLPEAECVVLERPPLVLALCQVRFEPVLGVGQETFVGPFHRAIRESYPRLSRFRQFALQIEAGSAEEPELVEKTPKPPAWRFSDREENWTVVLARDFLTLEVRRYGRFDEFLHRLREVLTALIEHIEPQVGTRLGLRYVNEIRLDEGGADDVIRRELLGPLAGRRWDGYAEQAVQQVLLRFPGHEGVNFTHGRLPLGSTVQGSEQEGPFYLLDMDVFREYRAPEALELDPGAICRRVETYHTAIHRLFRWAVTARYIETRQGRHTAEARR
jgi:uncharacterized protein (TIGR04255 family)